MSKKKKKDKNPNIKWGIALVVEIFVLVLMILGYGAFWANTKLDAIQYEEIEEEKIVKNEGANQDQAGYKTIALFGIDSRSTDDMMEGNRSDTIMIASINQETYEVRIVSVYRDTMLEIADGSGLTAKVNAAYSYGGPELAINTLNANLDLEITDFVTVNFLALSKTIDHLGGIVIHVEDNELPMLNACITEQINITGIYSEGVFTTGDLLLNGTQATGYARIRSTDQGDITRTERQRDVLNKMLAKAKTADVETLENIIDDVFPNVCTSISKDEMLALAKALLEYEMGPSVGFPLAYVPYDHETKGSILVPADLNTNVSALHEFLFGTTSYMPSQSVQNISVKLQTETGIWAQEIDLDSILNGQ
ncbi:MAG: LCP family protein [Lachnospiraceae bacterium]|nr:LCP family protein [Lachnospiraceae bacterium]